MLSGVMRSSADLVVVALFTPSFALRQGITDLAKRQLLLRNSIRQELSLTRAKTRKSSPWRSGGRARRSQQRIVGLRHTSGSSGGPTWAASDVGDCLASMEAQVGE
jgi:hypothetical protein